MRTELPKNVYIIYSLYWDGTEGILGFEYDRDAAVTFCRRMQALIDCKGVYVREYSKAHDIIVL